MDDILITNENISLKLSIKEKLENLEEILTKYQNSFDRKKNIEKIYKLEPPLIELNKKEKNFLKENIINVKLKFPKKIKTSEKDSELQIIIDYLFNLKESDNDIIHINEENKIKYFSITNKFKKVIEPGKDDNINKVLENIKETITSFSKMEEITYGDLIDFTFNTPNNKYMTSDSKVNYLLSFLKTKKERLEEINEQYEKFKREMKAKSRIIIKMVNIIDSEDNEEKYKNFIEKYEIKNDYNIIKEYLNILIKFSMPNITSKENNKNEKKEKDSNDGEEEDLFQHEIDEETNIMNEEEKLRNEIIIIFQKEPKFLKYIEIYLKHYLNKYVNNVKNKFFEDIKKIIENTKSLKLNYYKLGKIIEIINELNTFQLSIKDHFKHFFEFNENPLPKKKIQIGKDRGKVKEFTIDIFIEKLKKYIGDVEEKVDFYSEEPDDFILRLFLYKIGLNF